MSADRRPLPEPERIADWALHNLTGCGPLEPFLADDDGLGGHDQRADARLAKRHVGFSQRLPRPEVFHDDDHVERTLTKILDDATTTHRKLDPAEGAA